ncbi:aminoglycoside phosphotransferase family protein [Candidatus Woesearchaeota archaeon]|nr:aminoglycoside phosphotransferase family protein [Candidatus Woesearchaeota archaeon]
MIIGVDFDNTIVTYDELFHKIALEKDLISKELPKTKNHVRDYIRSIDKEDEWTKLQGIIYGSRIIDASPFPDVKKFFKLCIEKGIKIFIVSHKTKFPYLGDKVNLHDSAKAFLKNQGFFDKEVIGFEEKNAFFELTKEDKIERIRKLGCTHFIDDLPEFLSEKSFPDINKILFDPNDNHTGEKLQRASSWDDLIDKFKLSKVKKEKYFESNEFKKDVKNLLEKSMIKEGFRIKPLEGGKNNRVFKIETDNGNFLLKAYFVHSKDLRNRLNSEFSLLDYAWGFGLRNIHEPVSKDEVNNFGLYSFIRGEKVKEKINQGMVDAAAKFFVELNKNRKTDEAKALPEASESCFSIEKHLELVENRVMRLDKILSDSKINQEAIDFVKQILIPKWKEIKEKVLENIKKQDISVDEVIHFDEMVVSPSDFGFHNALVNNNGKISFLDFEYGGWDDPAKMVCDFFCQPKIPVHLNYFTSFCNKALDFLKDKEKAAIKAKILLPVYKIKWACIILNEFLITDSNRREFALDKEQNIDERKSKQLGKAKRYIQNIDEYLNLS